MSFVLDNSVAHAWCFEDEQTPAVTKLLDRLTQIGARAPLLWPLEALNGLLIAERQRRLDASKRAQLTGFLRELPVVLDLETADWTATAPLAERFNLSVHDAAYLELAQRRRLPLASLDGDLPNAAVARGLSVLGPAP
ncbi:type II toxin-antitoxin system VapC family toxin [Plastoroseomonas arctica]|uniref:Type II toxin-antitoxin system VapC family toxin n=1 Tax=Plastoroseomonas arctica TaxID=1509237 RepID=A0AAF1JV08_9PROT|nr:type II toxin-antitoxin system VapC family toxin [Plastoroseomonas arctica]